MSSPGRFPIHRNRYDVLTPNDTITNPPVRPCWARLSSVRCLPVMLTRLVYQIRANRNPMPRNQIENIMRVVSMN